MRDVIVEFATYCFDEIIPSNIKRLGTKTDVRHIYMVPRGNWTNLNKEDVLNVIEYGLKPALAASSKARGNGVDGFVFRNGVITLQDSIWFEQQGWPVGIMRGWPDRPGFL